MPKVKIITFYQTIFLQVLAVLFTNAWTMKASGQVDADPTLPGEMAEIFNSFCLHDFPDDAALSSSASKRATVPLTSEQVKRYLHSDPGRGWSLPSAVGGHYILTIEDPPFRACAVRRMTPSGFPSVMPYVNDIKAYAQSQGAQLSAAQHVASKTPDGLGDISVYGSELIDANGQPKRDIVAVFLTNYHGHLPADQRAEAGQGVGVEVRMVHQMPLPK